MKRVCMSTRRKKEKAERVAEFEKYLATGGKLNNYGNRTGSGKGLNITGRGY